jgi:hypothetical protein
LIFDQELPRVIEMMRSHLQTSSGVIGDWFLYVEYTKIRLYGFTRYPFLLPAFLTDRIFSLELARQKIHTEKEHLLNIKKGCNISFHYTIGPFVVKSSQIVQILADFLDTMKLQRTKRINYDPRGIMAARKKAIRAQSFKHQEITGLADRENAKIISLEQPSICVIEQSQEILGRSNINVAITLGIPTPATNEKGTKRTHDQMEGMDVDSHSSSKISKTVSVGKDIVVLDLEESDNKTEQGGKEGCLIQEEMSRQNESCDASSSEKMVYQFSF